jgi:hypothetical protein
LLTALQRIKSLSTERHLAHVDFHATRHGLTKSPCAELRILLQKDFSLFCRRWSRACKGSRKSRWTQCGRLGSREGSSQRGDLRETAVIC